MHGIMMMMRAEGFAQAPSGWEARLQGILPALLAFSLMTRPVALILLVGGEPSRTKPGFALAAASAADLAIGTGRWTPVV